MVIKKVGRYFLENKASLFKENNRQYLLLEIKFSDGKFSDGKFLKA